MHKQPSTKINKAQVKLKSIQSKIFMYFLKHTKTYLKNIPKIFQEYFKNILKIFMQNSQALIKKKLK